MHSQARSGVKQASQHSFFLGRPYFWATYSKVLPTLRTDPSTQLLLGGEATTDLPPEAYLSLASIRHQTDNQRQSSQACGCFIRPVLLYHDPQNPDCVAGLPRKAVHLLLFSASMVQLYCLSNCPSSCRCLSLSVLISTGTVDSM